MKKIILLLGFCSVHAPGIEYSEKITTARDLLYQVSGTYFIGQIAINAISYLNNEEDVIKLNQPKDMLARFLNEAQLSKYENVPKFETVEEWSDFNIACVDLCEEKALGEPEEYLSYREIFIPTLKKAVAEVVKNHLFFRFATNILILDLERILGLNSLFEQIKLNIEVVKSPRTGGIKENQFNNMIERFNSELNHYKFKSFSTLQEWAVFNLFCLEYLKQKPEISRRDCSIMIVDLNSILEKYRKRLEEMQLNKERRQKNEAARKRIIEQSMSKVEKNRLKAREKGQRNA
jgi:hypothetical protein